MKIHTIDTGHFKLDGGAMFGVVPKTMWETKHPADVNNMCSWAMRCLLIETNNKLILIDNGIGKKQDEKFLSYYHLHGSGELIASIRSLGYEPEDITDNILTHLHFDHCGGSLKWNSNKTKFEATFPNAKYHVHKNQWEWAINPNQREKASFLKDNILPLKELGLLNFIEEGDFVDGIHLKAVSGHTESMLIPTIDYLGRKIVFGADLFPSHHHIPLPWVMAYDTRPLLSLDEKEIFLKQMIREESIVFFEHDQTVECCTLKETERGIKVDETFNLKDWI